MIKFIQILTYYQVKMFYWVYKRLTHNYCDSCGWTKHKIHVKELFLEAGYMECENCSAKFKIIKNQPE